MNTRLTLAIAILTVSSLFSGLTANAQIHTVQFSPQNTSRIATRMQTAPRMIRFGLERWHLDRSGSVSIFRQRQAATQAAEDFEFAGTIEAFDSNAVYNLVAFDGMMWAHRDDGAVIQFAEDGPSTRVQALDGTQELIQFDNQLWALRFDGSVATVAQRGRIREHRDLRNIRQIVAFDGQLVVLDHERRARRIRKSGGAIEEMADLSGGDILAFDLTGIMAVQDGQSVGYARGVVPATTMQLIMEDARRVRKLRQR